MHILFVSITFQSLIACLTLAYFVSGCQDRNAGSAQVMAQSSAGIASAAPADKWLGKWSGPEGTFIQLIGGNGKYEVTVQNLDGPRVYQGKASGNQIEFDRDGVKESLRATDGVQTGMKWLSEKSNCLTVRTGEGYCRD